MNDVMGKEEKNRNKSKEKKMGKKLVGQGTGGKMGKEGVMEELNVGH